MADKKDLSGKAEFWIGLALIMWALYEGWGWAGIHWMFVAVLLSVGVLFFVSGIRRLFKKAKPEPKENSTSYVEVN